MRRCSIAVLLALISVAVCSSGCSTIADIGDQQRIYGGVRRVFEGRAPLQGGGGFSGGTSAEGVDLIFSCILDTAILPFTVIYALLRTKDPSPKQPH